MNYYDFFIFRNSFGTILNLVVFITTNIITITQLIPPKVITISRSPRDMVIIIIK